MTMLGAFCHIRDTNDEFFHVGHLAHFLHDANYAAFVVKRATEATIPLRLSRGITFKRATGSKIER